MQRIVIYGKGGIGKSTIAANLSVLYALRGLRVLHVGCDPKQDSTLRLLDGESKPSVLDALLERRRSLLLEHLIAKGRHGIECIESGGPEPGVGCGGRGVARMFEVLDELKLFRERTYDVVVYDVLGDVVCGGFAAPLRKGVAERIYVVTSEEIMSLYAANNIARAALRHAQNGVRFGGLVLNLRDNSVDRAPLAAFARRLNTEVLAVIERDPAVRRAEFAFRCVVEAAPDAPASQALRLLAERIHDVDGAPGAAPQPPPTPLSPGEFRDFVRENFAPEAGG